VPDSTQPDLIIVGGGGVGLATALAAADRGLSVTLVAEHRAGEAFPAAAGILGPSVELADHASAGAEHAFALASRDCYPEYLARLADWSGITVALNRLGILELALTEDATPHTAGATWLDAAALARAEPALTHALGAWIYPDDGAVDNVALFEALDVAVSRSERIHRVRGPATALAVESEQVVCSTAGGERLVAPQLVLAAGAWSPLIDGLPRHLPVEPLRGQMVSFPAAPLRHVVYGAGGYLVPREDRTLAGATSEHAAYDVSTTAGGVAGLVAMATTVCPALAAVPVGAAWAGLRPVSPDFLPIIGRDPDYPSLIYACGHSRNGVLMAPLTGDCVAALVAGDRPSADLTPFAIERFELTGQSV
jgi:glycine/D-amino acid oxidase-like deaminating enzyme